jgi:hypothetical protein
MAPVAAEEQDNEARKVEFEQVMRHATERAWADGLAEEVMAALFDVLNKDSQHPDDVAGQD